MEKDINLNRRNFLASTATVAGGLIVGFYLPTNLKGPLAFAADQSAVKPSFPPNAFVQIAPDGAITLVINKLEMGQGVNTSLAQLIAEELECDWTKIKSVSAPVNPVYNHTAFGMQMTGGSTALSSSWEQHRKIGAGMREMLKTAAAQKWGVPVSELKAEKGFIIHPKKGKLSYGELAEAANQVPFPENPPLKDPKNFKVIGKSAKRVDALEKSNGKAIFGMDVRIPGMVYAVVARPVILGDKISSMDEKAAKKVGGVVDVVKFGNSVAVLAKTTHAARMGREALNIKWKNSDNGKLSTDAMMKEMRSKASSKGLIAEEKGSVEKEMAKAAKMIEAEFEFPYLAHAPMEPLNCTVNYDGKMAEVWSGHQMPTMDRSAAAKTLGLPEDAVKVHTTYAGGSFGRRASKVSDYVVEACQLAKVIKKPVKVVYSREDDMHAGFYRPMNFHKVKIGLDDKNKFLAWDHHVIGNSVVGGSILEGMMVKDGLEATVTEGVSETAYNFGNFRCQQTRVPTPVTTLWWRSVGHTHTAYAMETMMDELAEATGKDALELRKSLLAKSPRHLAVLDLLKKQSGWGTKKAPQGRAWGLAVHESFNSVVGQIAEISVGKNGQPVVHKVWSAVHCGQVVNPEVAKTQIESAIVYGLSAALNGQIQIENGKVLQSNFNDYPVMRIQEMPVVAVEFVKTTDAPTGLGEPGLPPIAPAVANAYYKLTKKRLRNLPFSRETSLS